MNPYNALFHVTCESGVRFNYRTERHATDSYEPIKNLQDLSNYFNGNIEYYDNSVFGEEEWTMVREADWCFSTNDFELYVQNWMNRAGINATIGMIESGVYSNAMELAHSKIALEVLNDHWLDIDEIINDYDGFDHLTDSHGIFSTTRIPAVAFELTVRKWTIEALQIHPAWTGDARYEC